MVKQPKAGLVKTRLGAGIGMTDAAWWFRHQALGLIRRLRDPRWELVLSVAPDRTVQSSRVWPRDLQRIPQGSGDLGHRMSFALAHFRGPAILIGADIPAITKDHIKRAFAALGNSASVIGPATDGGFWLVGLRHPQRQPARLFHGVRWSAKQTLDDALPTLPGPIAIVDTLSDVDTVEDLKPR